MNFFRSEVYIHRVWERDQNGSCRLCRFPWGTFWLVSRIQHHLLFGDPLLDTLHYLQEHSCKDNLKIGVVKQKLTQFQRNRKLGFGIYIFVSLLTQRVVERMIGWLTVGKLATSVFHCWRGEEHTLPHITTHYYTHITTHYNTHITTHYYTHITTHSYTHYYTHIIINNNNNNNNNKLFTIVSHSWGGEHTLSHTHTFTVALGNTSQTNNYLLLGIFRLLSAQS